MGDPTPKNYRDQGMGLQTVYKVINGLKRENNYAIVRCRELETNTYREPNPKRTKAQESKNDQFRKIMIKFRFDHMEQSMEKMLFIQAKK